MPADRRIFRELRSETDLTEHVEYIADCDVQSAIRFLDAVESAFRRLRETPDPGWLWETDDTALAGIRVWPVSGFPNHLIFFISTEEEVRVLRVLHAARDIDSLLPQRS